MSQMSPVRSGAASVFCAKTSLILGKKHVAPVLHYQSELCKASDKYLKNLTIYSAHRLNQ